MLYIYALTEKRYGEAEGEEEVEAEGVGPGRANQVAEGKTL